MKKLLLIASLSMISSLAMAEQIKCNMQGLNGPVKVLSSRLVIIDKKVANAPVSQFVAADPKTAEALKRAIPEKYIEEAQSKLMAELAQEVRTKGYYLHTEGYGDQRTLTVIKNGERAISLNLKYYYLTEGTCTVN